MSASLVGSEMCIRDRNTSGAGRLLLPMQPQPGRADRMRPPTGGARGHPCLLYTSDAADDM
eukprot:2571446-Alexandrium_andersonii.AAC.1